MPTPPRPQYINVFDAKVSDIGYWDYLVAEYQWLKEFSPADLTLWTKVMRQKLQTVKEHDTTYELSSTALQLLKADFSPSEHNLFQVLLDDPAYITAVGEMEPLLLGSLGWTDKGYLMGGDHRGSSILKYFLTDHHNIDLLKDKLDREVPGHTADLMKRLIDKIPVREYKGETTS